MWQHLRRRQIGGNRFRRQHPIGDYVVDFFCFERALVIEIDEGNTQSESIMIRDEPDG